jgi:hypothetical protein
MQGGLVIMGSRRIVATSGVAIAVGVLAGCASSMPKPQYEREIVAEAHVSGHDVAEVKVDAADGVKILPQDEERLVQKIKAKIDARKEANVRTGEPNTYEVDLRLTRYEKGSAFARAMLAGLGQIHIDGKVLVYRMPMHTPVGEFALKKTFAWGGIYGAATSMDDIENTFADGVAAAVTGQKEEQTSKEKT